RRQVPLGSYVADFVCLEAKLIVEVDGVQHAESQRDLARDANLERFGFRVLRFWNDDVMHDLEATCATIMAYARDMSLRQDWRQTPLIRLRAFTERPDPPSPARGEGRRVGTGSVVYTAILRAGPGTVWIAGNVVHQYS
ncbi:MAG: endonuclease domain-containing protein, partial [Hoeflea sp.]|uniref:endonuclease domain-containing protein n=1 Tax=Hoeflea sp. TaxID=1940281 RepID=UPI0032975E28